MNTTQDNRNRLLDMAQGGDGHGGTWIEKVTFETTDREPEHVGCIMHIRNGRGKALHISGTEDTLQAVAACILESEPLPVEDTGRRVTAEEQRKYNI